MNQNPQDPKKKKVNPIKAFYQENPTFYIPKPILKDMRKSMGLSKNKMVKIASRMGQGKLDNRL